MARFVASFAAAAAAGAFGAVCHSNGAAADCSPNQSTFSQNDFRAFKLLSSRYESADTRRLYFALETADTPFVMPAAACVIVKLKDAEGNDAMRPFTPITANHTKGHFEIIVKKNLKDKAGNELFQLRPGEELLVKGPFEKFAYKANMWKNVGMLASGTGVAPMYRLLQEILANPRDKTHVSLVYGNEKRADILLANELRLMQETYNNFNLYLTLQEVPPRWLGGIGRINEAMIRTFMPKPGEKYSKILVSGPPVMMRELAGERVFPEGKLPEQGPLKGLLKDMGYSEGQVFKF
ncbi:unnamed protein product [Trypanosoma congolense IL3000]|uniref:cytochrome-b5 reductase n=1 Tax=Trypanosoma congolense (strain IL3000) TaxID=1068625 RepID=F9W3S1_TRYCI|nr:unnamed protein product [Trypanosoma congolense IL3000]CCD14525.1 unnamed protein product [Trypanosoma congolense IL3000]